MLNTKKFKYSLLLRKAINSEKSNRAIENRSLDKGDRISGNDKIALLNALGKIRKFMATLQQGSKNDKELYDQLCLERDYIRELEKEGLRIKIERALNQPVGGSYTLAEIGKVLGITRERVRQIEASAQKVLRHPTIARKLKIYQKDG